MNPYLTNLSKERVVTAVLLAAVAAAYIPTTNHVKSFPRPKEVEEINVAVSPAIQIVLSGGDRFLAANLAVFRATIVPIKDLNSVYYPTLAKIQEDASLLNPAQEDNYYIAQGILPWIDEHPTAIRILHRASEARPFDFMPPYFLGFDYMYFESRFEESGRHYKLAADRVSGKNRDALLNNAAKFMEKGDNPANAIQFLDGLIKSTRNKNLQQFLRARIVRLQRLIILRDATAKYTEKYQRPPTQLNDLVESGMLPFIPVDPLGTGYTLDENGVPQIIFHIRRFPKL